MTDEYTLAALMETLREVRAERDALADALREYADEGNWDTEDGPPFVWVKDSHPPSIARAALDRQEQT